MNNEYWAKAPKSDIAQEIMGKWEQYHKWMRESGLRDVIQTCYEAFYSMEDGAFKIVKSVDGSSAKIKVKHLKSLIQRVKSIVTQAKLTYQPKAINSSSDSQVTSDFAKGLLEYYGDEKDMTRVVSDMVELGLITLDSYIFAPWDYNRGDDVRPGAKNGDQVFHVLSRFDVASHTTLTDTPYYIVRERVNKYDLAAEFPKFKREILESGDGRSKEEYLTTPLESNFDDEDLIEKFTFIHRKSMAVPKGRYTVVCAGEVLEDRAFHYREFPIVHFQPGKMHSTTCGDSPITSLISLQEGVDALYSAVVSNNLQYSQQNIWSPSAIQVEPLSEGFNNIVSAQKPEALQLVESSKETYNLIELMQGQQQLLSGVNDTARGAPEASLKSGNSLALMLSVAVQFADETQKAYVGAAGQLATIVIANLQEFANEERLAYIGGPSKKSEVRSFTGEDLHGVRRVSCELSNPLTQNVAGRYELVQQWQQYGVLKDPKKLVEFLRTGQLDSITEDDFKDSLLIRLENEGMLKGELPIVMATDIHPEHIMNHRALASDPLARQDPKLMEVLNAHLLEHRDAMKNLDPDLAAVLGIPPLPSQQMGPPPEEGGEPGGAPPPGPGEPVPEEVPLADDPAGMAGGDVNLPSLPEGTPEEFTP